jgi:hypothetical protein
MTQVGEIAQLTRLKAKLAQVVAIDFFGANGRETVDGLLTGLETKLTEVVAVTGEAPHRKRATLQGNTKPALCVCGRTKPRVVPAKILNQRHFFFGFTSGCGNGGGTAELCSLICGTFPYEVSGVGLFGLVGRRSPRWVIFGPNIPRPT